MNELMRRRDMMVETGYEVMWNQLVKNGDFNDKTEWREIQCYYSVNNKTATVVFPDNDYEQRFKQEGQPYGNADDVYFLTARVKCNTPEAYGYEFTYETFGSWIRVKQPVSGSWTKIEGIVQSGLNFITNGVQFFPKISAGQSYDIQNVQVVNLTQMFGSGNEPTTAAQFEAWLQENGIDPDSYIPYDAGTPRKMTKPSWIL